MANFNFGVIKATFTNYLNESENVFAKEVFNNFMKLIKESTVLKAQFQVYKNLEEKYIPNENLAIKYIDENIEMLKKSCPKPVEALESRNAQLEKVCKGIAPKLSDKKKTLYENIQTLINQSLTTTDVDSLHESFSYVLNHLTTNKPKLFVNENSDYNSLPKEFLIRKAVEKFNAKYNSLNESEKELLKTIVSESSDVKIAYFSAMKNETVSKLKSILGESETVDKNINEALTKVNEMSFNEDTYSTDVLKLKEFKESLS